jgi:hypothetical protein
VPTRLTAASRRAGAWTTFTTLLLRSVPPEASIRVTCHGKGCPKRVSVRPAHGVARLTALLHRRLGVGVRITIRITRPDAPVQTIRITVRRGRAPKVG